MAAVRMGVAAFMAAAGAFGPPLGAHSSSRTTVSPFGGSVPVRIARVGSIDVDLGAAGSGDLRRVTCFAAAPATACFITAER